MNRTAEVSLACCVVLAACGGGGASRSAPVETLRVQIALTNDPCRVTTADATVTANGMSTIGPVALEIADGVIRGRFDQVPAGAARTLTVRAYDAYRQPVYEGSATVDVVAGQQARADLVLARNLSYCPDTSGMDVVGTILSGGGPCNCDPKTEVCLSGRCFPIKVPPASEPAATPAKCGAFQQVVGPAITAAAPPAGGPCATTLQSSGTPGATLDLGDKTVGTTVEFQLPAGASSFTIVMQAVNVPTTQIALQVGTGTATMSIDNTAVPLVLNAPDGSVWYDDMQPLAADGSSQLVFFASNSPGVGSLLVPNTTKSLQVVDTTGLPVGKWTFTVSDYAYECATESVLASQCGAGVAGPTAFASYTKGVYRVAVNLNVAARPPQGTVNVGLYLHACPGAHYDTNGVCTDARPLTAVGAPTDPDAQRFLQTLASLLSGGGLCLGQVTWYDLPAWAQTKWKGGLDLDATTCDVQLGQLLSLSRPMAGGQMSLFLVPDILAKPSSSSSPTHIVGIDGTIPGPGTYSGTVQSGAAVSAANLRAGSARCAGALALSACGADQTAYIAAHEIGHYLGLYHTTESAGADFDPLDDTFQCQCSKCLTGAALSQCGSAGAEVMASSCNQSTTACGGGKNLMFWLLDPSVSRGALSPQQSSVMRSSAIVH